jgi:hypothetical protein
MINILKDLTQRVVEPLKQIDLLNKLSKDPRNDLAEHRRLHKEFKDSLKSNIDQLKDTRSSLLKEYIRIDNLQKMDKFPPNIDNLIK